jgi:hypothetical protein
LLSIVAWFAILFTGKYPVDARVRRRRAALVGERRRLHVFTRDEYPPFFLRCGRIS